MSFEPVEIRKLSYDEFSCLEWVIMSARPGEQVIGPSLLDDNGRRIGQLVCRILPKPCPALPAPAP